MQVCQRVPLHSYTTLRIGGISDALAIAHTVEEILALLLWARERNVECALLGRGSNVLISDEGISGLVVINRCSGVESLPGDQLRVMSGTPLESVVGMLADQGLSGMEALAGIPGTIGGAVCGNAGAYGRCIAEFVRCARLVHPSGEVETVGRSELGFDYRHSKLKSEPHWLLDVTLEGFVPASSDAIRSEMKNICTKRWEKLPGRETATAGSFFKNLPPLNPGEHRRAIGAWLDQAGAKSLRVGDAAVYPKHANVIVNTGSATARDVLALARRMASLVKEQFGIIAEPEVRLMGRNLCWQPV